VRYLVDIAGEALELDVEQAADGTFRVRTQTGQEFSVRTLMHEPGLHTLAVAEKTVEVQLGEGQIKFSGDRFLARVQSERERAAAHAGTSELSASKEIVAPMPGRIVRVLCVPGAAVHPGEPLIVIEAMKMQNELCAKTDEVVRVVRVAGGETVDRGAVLIEFE
jgi:acetyl/propionyl-CoA carboxylase alpha subunit